MWQPFGSTTLARIIQALTVPSSPATWIEIQDPNHSVLRLDTTETDLRFQFRAELELRLLPQTKERERGVWRPILKNGTQTNKMRIRVPHK